jgi:hypothetical protein
MCVSALRQKIAKLANVRLVNMALTRIRAYPLPATLTRTSALWQKIAKIANVPY